MDVFQQHLIDLLTAMIGGLLRPVLQIASAGDNRLFWLYLLAATAIVYGLYRFRAPLPGEPRDHGFLGFLLPRAVWRHQSAQTDVGLVLISSVLLSVLLAPLLVTAGSVSAWLVERLAPEIAAQPLQVWQLAVFAVTLLIVDDFAKFLGHALMHRVPALWELHKVHHSAEVLTPITAYRFHTLETLFMCLVVGLAMGAANAAFILAWGPEISLVTLFQANIGLVLFNLLGGTLRHSHIWLSYGPRVERILISPAMHQIHHSDDPKHFDRNLGYHLAIWDRLYGTHYRPAGFEALSFGLGEETARLRSVPANLLRPLGAAAGHLIPRARHRKPTTSG